MRGFLLYTKRQFDILLEIFPFARNLMDSKIE